MKRKILAITVSAFLIIIALCSAYVLRHLYTKNIGKNSIAFMQTYEYNL